jgi:uncharacterized protein YgbK (DUF1537 family)
MGNTKTTTIVLTDPMPSGDRPKIIVLDDDPTGSQTVHSCPLLLRWDKATLRWGLQQDSPLCFILTNTRSCASNEAARITREVCRNLKQVLGQIQLPQWLLISRSDSTLRGHFPLEPQIITEELGPFDAQFLVPAFLEGGRFTRQGVHYLRQDDTVLPVHETEFARDPSFGFQHSYLPAYIAEKTGGEVAAASVVQLYPNRAELVEAIARLSGGTWAIVNAETPADFQGFATAIDSNLRAGRRYLFRSAASLISALAQLSPQPLAPAAFGQLRRAGQAGLFLIGSYTERTSLQLQKLLQMEDVVGLELPLFDRLTDPNTLLRLQSQLRQLLRDGKTPVVYTPRQPMGREDPLRFGQQMGDRLNQLVCSLQDELSYVVSKGGNTSNSLLREGLGLSHVRLLGQILPGVCVVQPEAQAGRPVFPVVLFPGNLGTDKALVEVFRLLTGQAQ